MKQRSRRSIRIGFSKFHFPWTTTAVHHVMGTTGLNDAERIAILGGNLERLLGM